MARSAISRLSLSDRQAQDPFIDVKMPRADVSTRGNGALVGGTGEGQRNKLTLRLSQLTNQST
jgi:hypothetical protein